MFGAALSSQGSIHKRKSDLVFNLCSSVILDWICRWELMSVGGDINEGQNPSGAMSYKSKVLIFYKGRSIFL